MPAPVSFPQTLDHPARARGTSRITKDTAAVSSGHGIECNQIGGGTDQDDLHTASHITGATINRAESAIGAILGSM